MSAKQQRTFTLGEIAQVIGATVRGDASLVLRGVAGLAEAVPGDVAFYNNTRYRPDLDATQASAVVVAPESADLVVGRAALVVDNPYYAFARVSTMFHAPKQHAPGVDPRAVIEPGAEIDATATVMAYAFVSRGARVGAGAVLYPFVFLGEGAVVGEGSTLYPGVVVREDCYLGARAMLHAGAVIGADGFGFAFDPTGPQHYKIPQVGTVEVGDDVEVGANSAIDRATLGATRVGAGSKIDNLCQIGHNVELGPLCIVCGQSGIAGSSKLGPGVLIGGQVGVLNHARIAGGARVGAKTGVLSDIDEPGEYLGTPAAPAKEWLRAQVFARRGHKLQSEVRRLNDRVEQLEAQLKALLEKKA